MRRPQADVDGADGADLSARGVPTIHIDFEQAIVDLDREVAQLREALQTRQQIGVATGILAARFGCSPERAWSLLVRVSQAMNVKVRDIARVVGEAQADRVAAEDVELLARLSEHLPNAWPDLPGRKR